MTLRTLAEMENLRERTKRQGESDRKFALQNFVKDLLDVADNLQRAAATIPEEERAALEKADGTGAGNPKHSVLLQQMLVGVLLTEKQLLKVRIGILKNVFFITSTNKRSTHL